MSVWASLDVTTGSGASQEYRACGIQDAGKSLTQLLGWPPTDEHLGGRGDDHTTAWDRRSFLTRVASTGENRVNWGMPITWNGRYFNWHNRYWHDWPEVEAAVREVAKAHARYLGYEVHGLNGTGPPLGDIRAIGPVMRVNLIVFRRSGKHRQPEFEDLSVDVERRAGKFHAKTARGERD